MKRLKPGTKIKHTFLSETTTWVFLKVETMPLIGRVYRFKAETGNDTLSIPEGRIPKSMRTGGAE